MRQCLSPWIQGNSVVAESLLQSYQMAEEMNQQSKPYSQGCVLEQDVCSLAFHTPSPPQTPAFVSSFSIMAGPKGHGGSLAEEEKHSYCEGCKQEVWGTDWEYLMPGRSSAPLQHIPSFSAGVWIVGCATQAVPVHSQYVTKHLCR